MFQMRKNRRWTRRLLRAALALPASTASGVTGANPAAAQVRPGSAQGMGVLGLLLTALVLMFPAPAYADENYCNELVGTSVEEVLARDGALAALDRMSDGYYTRKLQDLPAHYWTCPLVTRAINEGAEQVVLRAHPSPWWEALWRWNW